MKSPPAGTVSTTDVALHVAREQAAQWFALLRSGDATAADEANWRTWLDASTAHREAWAQVERISQCFAPLRGAANGQAAACALATARRRLARRRHLLRSMALVTVGSTAGWGLWRCTDPSQLAANWPAGHRACAHAMQTQVLADGSRVWLAPGSEIRLNLAAQARRVQMISGELFIDTAPEANRPFIVDTTLGRLHALGTRFNVRLWPDSSATLAVFDGAVALRTAETGEAVIVNAGRQCLFNAARINAQQPADPQGQAWIRGILLAQDMALKDVVTELARYRRGHLAVAPEVAGLRVHGSFPLFDTDRALAMLAGVLPLRIRQPLPWWTSLHPAR